MHHRAFDSVLRVSRMMGRGYQFLMLMALSPRSSTHRHQELSAFSMNSTGKPAGLELARMKHF